MFGLSQDEIFEELGSGQIFTKDNDQTEYWDSANRDNPSFGENPDTQKSGRNSSRKRVRAKTSEDTQSNEGGVSEEESVWLMHMVVTPNLTCKERGDVTYDVQLKHPNYSSANVIDPASTGTPEHLNKAQDNYEAWMSSNMHILANLNPDPEKNTFENLPPFYAGCPKDINVTVPEQKQWVEDFKNGKFGTYRCTAEDLKFDPLPSDEPLKVHLKNGAKFPKMHRYRTPEHLIPEFKRFIDEMLEKGWIVPTDAEWAAPVLIIKKPGTYEDGTSKGYRFVSDFRRLNSILRPLQHYMPDVQEMWEQLKDAKYISVCDMRHGFFNAPLHEESQKYVGINSPWGCYAYKCVPQGLVNSSAYFQRWVTRKLRKHGILYEPTNVSSTPASELDGEVGFQENLEGHDSAIPKSNSSSKDKLKKGNFVRKGFVCAYQDDLVCFSSSAAEHREHLKILFTVLSEEHIPLNLKKSQLFCRHVRYLGCVVGAGHLYLDPEKCNSIHNKVVTKDLKSIRGFLGMTGFYRRWIKDYAAIAAPLFDMLKKDVKIPEVWSEAQDTAVLGLKTAVTSYPVLRQPMMDRPWILATDASDLQIGGSIGQKVDGKMTVTAFCSRALKGPELNYPVQHKEALACVWAVKKFNHYLQACPHFTIRMWTDHHSLQFMQNQKDLAGRMARWAMFLAAYRCTIKSERTKKRSS